MADTEKEYSLGVIDKRNTQAQTQPAGNTWDSRYYSVNQLRTRLTTLNAAYYTSAVLNQMTKNDMVYALRTIDDAAGI